MYIMLTFLPRNIDVFDDRALPRPRDLLVISRNIQNRGCVTFFFLIFEGKKDLIPKYSSPEELSTCIQAISETPDSVCPNSSEHFPDRQELNLRVFLTSLHISHFQPHVVP